MDKFIEFREVHERAEIDGSVYTVTTWLEYRVRILSLTSFTDNWSDWKRIDLNRVDQHGNEI